MTPPEVKCTCWLRGIAVMAHEVPVRGGVRVYDVSMDVCPGMPVYKNEERRRPVFETVSRYADGALETRLHLDSHTGTHLDAPSHMIPDGRHAHEFPPDALVGECRVLGLDHVKEKITEADLRAQGVMPGEFVLLRTRNSQVAVFDPGFVYLAHDGAELLAALPVRGVGIDALGIERDQPGHPSHVALFRSGVLVLEGLRLAGVAPGRYFLVIAPLKLIGTDAAPARVYLFEGLSGW
ncbi:MAG: arylformamidase [Bacillota bacterium]|nr:arylformamidase [Bacillota bacterium]